MALVTENSVLLHIPKTGGVFIKYALVMGGVKHTELGGQHEHFPRLLKMKPRSFFEDRLVYTFVRHPLSWYQSRWAFRVRHGWQPKHPLDFNCASNDFQRFMHNVLQFKPDGWCGFLFDEYIKNEQQLMNFVGRTENLVDDFLKVMSMANETIDEDRIRSLPRVNDSHLDGQNSNYWAKYSPELYNRVLAVESNVIQEYYHDYEPDPAKYIGELPY